MKTLIAVVKAIQKGLLLALALAGAVGCQPAKETFVAEGGTDPAPLLAKIPADLRYKPKPEDTAAQDRYIQVLKALIKDPLRNQGYYSGQPSLPCTPETLTEIRRIIRSGPIELGYDEVLDDPQSSFYSVSPTSVLSSSASAALRSGKRQQAVEDDCLMIKWILGLSDPQREIGGMSWEYSRELTEAFRNGGLTRAEKQKILDAFPSESERAEAQRNQIKLGLEERVIALAAISAPRKNMVVTRFGPVNSITSFNGFPPSGARGPVIPVPPHGTLDRQATLESLVEMARKSIRQLELGGLNPSNSSASPPVDMVKWLPTLPSLRTATKREIEVRKKQIQAYVEEMNKGENTLGRELIRGGIGASMMNHFPNRAEEMYRSLKQLADNPPPLSRNSTGSRLPTRR